MAGKGKGGNTVAAVWQIAEPIAKSLGLELWDVRFVKEGVSWYLRIFIDKEGGVGIEDCENMSRAIDAPLDEADPIPDSYVFEVGSAGAERELKRPGDFEQFMGSEVEVRLYKPINGSKVFVGTLAGYDDGDVTLKLGDQDMRFEKAAIALVKLHVSI